MSDEVTLVAGDATPGPGQRAARTSRLQRGSTLGRYVVLDMIGSGGMGVVYSAFDPKLDRRVAIKMLLPRPGEDAEGIARLTREAQAMARLSHPNVVTIHDVSDRDGVVFLAMEFVEGSTIRTWAEATPRSWREIVGVFAAAGRGLAAAHAAGLVHRDF